jgi:ABC-type transporter Mla subunit MlaD
MGEKVRFYIIIIVLVGIVLLQFLFKPKPGPDQPSFENTLNEIKGTLKDFDQRNQEIKNAAAALSANQAAAEAHYAQVRQEFQTKLDAISGQIASARTQYVGLMKQLGELNEQFKDSGAPDSIPTLDQLTKGN